METHREEPSPAEMVPFGRFGSGQWTGHSIGLLIAAGLLLMGLVGVPSFAVFLLPRWPSAEYLVSSFGDTIDNT